VVDLVSPHWFATLCLVLIAQVKSTLFKDDFALKQILQLVRPSIAVVYLMNAMLGDAWAVAVVMGP
jgi:hypothetical protein